MGTASATNRIGWIGIGRMGYEMAARLARCGADVTVWNRTRAKAEPLAQYGAKVADRLADLASYDVVFVMVSAWDDAVKEVVAGPGGLLSGKARPRMVVECSSISLEGSAELREMLRAEGVELLAAPVSGNAKVIKAGRLSFVCSGPRAAYDAALPYLKLIAPSASYVGEGELARIVKICHNVFLGVVIQSLAEITILAQKAGVPRHAFLDFMNQSVMGSTFSRYKTPALFIWHGYTDLWIEGDWRKATPAFNLSLCERFGLHPLEFNGLDDSIYHEFDKAGNRHMEYVNQRGTFDDMPLEQMVADFARTYGQGRIFGERMDGADFLADVERETR